jgi:hypothetical protein
MGKQFSKIKSPIKHSDSSVDSKKAKRVQNKSDNINTNVILSISENEQNILEIPNATDNNANPSGADALPREVLDVLRLAREQRMERKEQLERKHEERKYEENKKQKKQLQEEILEFERSRRAIPMVYNPDIKNTKMRTDWTETVKLYYDNKRGNTGTSYNYPDMTSYSDKVFNKPSIYNSFGYIPDNIQLCNRITALENRITSVKNGIASTVIRIAALESQHGRLPSP